MSGRGTELPGSRSSNGVGGMPRFSSREGGMVQLWGLELCDVVMAGFGLVALREIGAQERGGWIYEMSIYFCFDAS